MQCESLEDRRLLSTTVIHSTDFNDGTPEPGWSPPGAYVYGSGDGQMYAEGNASMTLTLDDVDPHTDIAIDYFPHGVSWFGYSQGDPVARMGDEDVFEVLVDGNVVYRYTATWTPYLFEEEPGQWYWYPDVEEDNDYFNGAWLTPNGTLCVPHTGSSLEIEFKASQLEWSQDNDNWELDDVSVSAYQPTVTIAASDSAAAEDGNTGQFTVTRDANPFRQDPYDGNLTVNLAEPTGGAEEGVDYSALPDTATIYDGNGSASPLTVTPLVDQIVEGAEDVVLALASGSSYAIGAPNSAIVTLAAQTYKILDYSDVNAAGASPTNRKTINPGNTEDFHAIAVRDNNDNPVTGTLKSEVKPAGGGAIVPGITVTFAQTGAGGNYKATVTVGGAVAPGNYNIKVWLDENPLNIIYIYITV